MAVVRKFDGKSYRYSGCGRHKLKIQELASRLRKQGKLVRIARTGKGLNTVYTLYVREK